MRVVINKTVYEVIEQAGDSVCILQTFPYADGLSRQLRIWTKQYETYKEEI